MARYSRAGIAVLVVLAAAGIGAAVHLLHEEAAVPETTDGGVVDAATDARGPAKPKAGKKPSARGGKTRVAGHVAPRAPAATAHPTATAHAAPHAPDDAPNAPTPPTKSAATHAGHHEGPSGPSYESALDANDEQVAIGAKSGADLTDAQLSAPMSDGAFLGDCDTPDSTSVTVKVAIRAGHAVGVSVDTSPHSPHVSGCIERYVRTLSWPVSAKMDSLVTTY